MIGKTHPLVEIRVNLIRVFIEKGNLLSSIFENLKSNINHMHLDNHLTQNSLKMFHMVVIENDSVKPSCDIANSAKHGPCLGLPRPVHVVTAFAVNSVSWDVVVLRTFVGGRWTAFMDKTLSLWGHKSCSYQTFRFVGSKPPDSLWTYLLVHPECNKIVRSWWYIIMLPSLYTLKEQKWPGRRWEVVSHHWWICQLYEVLAVHLPTRVGFNHSYPFPQHRSDLYTFNTQFLG